jgi:cell division protein ZapA (FtsZ GTPase activity inhibitor)
MKNEQNTKKYPKSFVNRSRLNVAHFKCPERVVSIQRLLNLTALLTLSGLRKKVLRTG